MISTKFVSTEFGAIVFVAIEFADQPDV